MAVSLGQLPSRDPESGLLNAVVDTPKGSRNKYKHDDKLGIFRLSKVLPLGASFPFDFGFIPCTRGGDGDPLDVLVLMDEPAFTGCVVPARLIRVIDAEQTQDGRTVRNDRLVAVAETPYNPQEYHSLEDLSEQRLAEIEHFFVSYNAVEGRQFRPIGRRGPEQAERKVEDALEEMGSARRTARR
jgi:inorganic pyrophosphatase